MKNKEDFEKQLVAGTKVKIGKEYAKEYGFPEGEIITLINLEFEFDNDFGGGFEYAPGIMSDPQNEADSIYHLFGNDFECWLDNTIVE